MEPGTSEEIAARPSQFELLDGSPKASSSSVFSRMSTECSQHRELEHDFNGELKQLTRCVQKFSFDSDKRFATLQEQVRKLSKQILQVQRTLAGAFPPPGQPRSCSNVSQPESSHGSNFDAEDSDASDASSPLRSNAGHKYGIDPLIATPSNTPGACGGDACSAGHTEQVVSSPSSSSAKVMRQPAMGACAGEESSAGHTERVVSSVSSSSAKKMRQHATGACGGEECSAGHTQRVVSSSSSSSAKTMRQPAMGACGKEESSAGHTERVVSPPSSSSAQKMRRHATSIQHAQRAACVFSSSPRGQACSFDRYESHKSRGFCAEGDRPDASHSSLQLRACQRRGNVTSPCLPVIQEPPDEMNADHGRHSSKSSSLGALPSLSGHMKKRGIGYSEVLDRPKHANSINVRRSSSLSSQAACSARYEALISVDLDKPSAPGLPGQLDSKDYKGSRGVGPVPEAGQPDMSDSFDVWGLDASTASALQIESREPTPQTLGVHSVLPGELQGSRGRETHGSGELHSKNTLEQHEGTLDAHHDPDSRLGRCSEWPLMARLQARLEGMLDGVVVLLRCIPGQDSSTSRRRICKIIFFVLAASAPVATYLPVKSMCGLNSECMPLTRSGFALRCGALVSTLVWLFLRPLQRTSCEDNIGRVLCRAGLDHDFEATSRWDAIRVVMYWMLIVATKLSLLALEFKRCASDTGFAEAVSATGFVVSTGLFLSMVFAFTQMLCMLDLVVKDFPDWAVTHNDLPEVMNEWRERHCAIKSMCQAFEFQSLTVFIVPGIVGAFVLADLSDKSVTRALPENMVACSLLFVIWRATSVTRACRRVTAALSTAELDEGPLADRMCMLMDHIDRSKAGFYVVGVHFTPDLVFKMCNAAAVITFALMSRFSPLLQRS
eukprot:TRINITY_DN16846_c1_g1_i3.p1 TRINITY_DN16846_c1_g1~~TRINITY_DN16846_c1_g1_i3.p1  ORF type:complete len:894 (-),score=105.65 TRINITY_DN16846_c1_g1_i3:151-2832(-)